MTPDEREANRAQGEQEIRSACDAFEAVSAAGKLEDMAREAMIRHAMAREAVNDLIAIRNDISADYEAFTGQPADRNRTFRALDDITTALDLLVEPTHGGDSEEAK